MMNAKLGEMKDDNPPSWYTVTNPEMAQALSEPETRSIFAVFIKQPTTIKEAAQQLDLTLNQMLYKVRRLHRLGLLQIIHKVKRKGRAINHYQAIAKQFFVPYHSSPFTSPIEWLIEDYREREKQLAEAVVEAGSQYGNYRMFGKRIFFRENDIFETDFAFTPTQEADLLEADAPAVSNYFIETQLSLREAKSLQLEIANLIQRYEKKGQEQTYLLRLGLAPLTKLGKT